MFWVSYSTRKSSFRRRLIERALRQRVRFFVSEYILSELEVTLVVNLKFTVRFAHLARKAALRAAKLVPIPPTIRRLVPGHPKHDPTLQTPLSAHAHSLVT